MNSDKTTAALFSLLPVAAVLFIISDNNIFQDRPI